MVELSTGWFVLLILLAFSRIIIIVIITVKRIWVHFCVPELSDLRSKFGDWAVVTGSTDGIGKEYAKELAKRNMNLILISRSLEKLNQTKNEIEQINPTIEIKIIQADFSKGREELNQIKTELKNIPVGILVNNVGKMTETLDYLEKLPEEISWEMVTINAGITTLMTHMIIEQMKTRRKGVIVNVSSGAHLMPMPLQTVYAASKIFVNSFSDAIRLECAKDGITVQCLSPFYINTKLAGFIPSIKNLTFIYPDASTYARNAIRTLGKLDSTSGYWIHEIITLFLKLVPVWFRSRLSFILNKLIQRDYLNHQQRVSQKLN